MRRKSPLNKGRCGFKRTHLNHNKPLTSKQSSQLQEQRVAKELNGKVTPGSGNMFHAKSDVVTNILQIECKTTSKKSIRITEEWLFKIENEALWQSKLPILAFNLCNKDYCIVRLGDFSALLEELQELRKIDESLLNSNSEGE